jgi:uncharacterized membrane protein
VFVHQISEVLAPGRAALFLVVQEAWDPEAGTDALRPLSPRVLHTTLDD